MRGAREPPFRPGQRVVALFALDKTSFYYPDSASVFRQSTELTRF